MSEKKCERCGYEWVSKTKDGPKTCPSCKSPYWKKPMDDFWRAMKKKRDAKKAEK